MASVKETKNKNRYIVKISNGYNDDGTRDRATFTITAKSKADAIRQANTLEVEYKKNKNKSILEYTLKDVVNQWERLVAPKKALITAQRYKFILKSSILPRFGNLKLNEIRVIDIENYLEDLRLSGKQDGTGYSEQTVLHHFSTLRMLFECGKKWGMYEKNNPLNSVQRPSPKDKEKRVYSPEDIKKLVISLEQEFDFLMGKVVDIEYDDKIKRYKDIESNRVISIETIKNVMFIMLCLSTGARKGELLGLTLDRIFWEENSIRIKDVVQNVTGIGQIIKENPKNRFSERTITIPQKTMEMLKSYKIIHEKLRHNYSEEYKDSIFLFTQKTGKPLSYNTINKWFNKYTQSKGFKQGNIHILRHSFISNLIYTGKVDIVSISRHVGHSNANTTLSCYAHLIKGADKKTAAAISEVMFD